MAEIDKKNGAAKMNWLFAPLEDIDEYRALRAAAEKPGVLCVTGLDDSQRLHLLAGLARETGRMLLFVTATDQLAQKATDDLLALMNGRVQLLPAREINFLRVAAASGDLAARRVEAMGAALAGGLRALVAPVDALMFRLMPPASFKRGVIKLQRGLVIEPKDLMARLIDAGYERVDVVESRGQCALRGGIIDVFPVGRASALRIEFFDDELDMLREFDALTQRSTDEIERAWVLPANETILTADEASAAAERILRALGRHEEDEQRAGESAGDRQRAIEEQFGLTPWDDFAREISDALDELPSLDEMSADRAFSQVAKPAAPQGELEKQFLPRVEALRATRSCPAAESMMPYLYEQCACVMDYLKDPIVVLDQPDRLRTRCENRMLEFEEQFKVALERENALPGQAELLIGYDELLRRLTEGTAVATMPLAVSQPDLRFAGLFRFEGLSGGGYQSNMHELARDIKTWKKEGWRVGLLMGGTARGQRLSRTLALVGVVVVIDAVLDHALLLQGELEELGGLVEVHNGLAVNVGDVVDAVDVADSEVLIVEEGLKAEVVGVDQAGIPEHRVILELGVLFAGVAQLLHLVAQLFQIAEVVEGIVFNLQAQIVQHVGVVDQRDEVAVVLQGRNAVDVTVNLHAIPDVVLEQRLGVGRDGVQHILEGIVRAALRLHDVVQLGLGTEADDADVLAGGDHGGHLVPVLLARPVVQVDVGVDLFLQILVDSVVDDAAVVHLALAEIPVDRDEGQLALSAGGENRHGRQGQKQSQNHRENLACHVKVPP